MENIRKYLTKKEKNLLVKIKDSIVCLTVNFISRQCED